MAALCASLPPALAGVACQVVAVAGPRALCPASAGLVANVAGSIVSAGASLVVGCATGADAAALSAVPVGSVRLLAAFGPGGRGSWSCSAVTSVSRFVTAGGSAVWWAGGGPAVPLRARLAARTRAVVASASALVVFFSARRSRGSLLAAHCAVKRGVPVVAIPLGIPATQLPTVAPGVWAATDISGVWSCARVWVPAQAPALLDS